MAATNVPGFVVQKDGTFHLTKDKSRINFIDGLRGLAAFYVLVYHASIAIFVPNLFGGTKITGTVVDRLLDIFLLLLQSFQHYAVVLFIVISGYSLMLSVARSKDEKLPGGILLFFRRRAIRLLPTYYAALVLTIGLLVVLSPNVVTMEDAITHIFLVHNWFPASIYTLDGPMWSLAVEWQIYFLFPVLLIPIWRRFGSYAMVLVGIVLGLAIQFIVDNDQTFIFAWFIGLFALGMLSASIGFSKRATETWLKEVIPWGILTIFFIVIWGLVRNLTKTDNFERDINWYKDTIAGLVFCSLLIYLTRVQSGSKGNTKSNILFRVISSRILTFLGLYSYSIYLFHAPIFIVLLYMLKAFPLPAFFSWLLILLLGVPIALVGSYICYLAFEKPFVKLLRMEK